MKKYCILYTSVLILKFISLFEEIHIRILNKLQSLQRLEVRVKLQRLAAL